MFTVDTERNSKTTIQAQNALLYFYCKMVTCKHHNVTLYIRYLYRFVNSLSNKLMKQKDDSVENYMVLAFKICFLRVVLFWARLVGN
jgi:hypothetical protein